jgi:hypothetical protein
VVELVQSWKAADGTLHSTHDAAALHEAKSVLEDIRSKDGSAKVFNVGTIHAILEHRQSIYEVLHDLCSDNTRSKD